MVLLWVQEPLIILKLMVLLWVQEPLDDTKEETILFYNQTFTKILTVIL